MAGRNILAFLLLLSSWAIFAQDEEQSPLDPNIDKVRGLVSYYRYLLNTIGNERTPLAEKEIIINDSYLKVFRDPNVQIEDDLVKDRTALVNKNIQAYLRDVDFFFTHLKFDFSEIKVEKDTSENGNIYYLASFLSELQGITIDGDSIQSNIDRFMEVNIDPTGLKIVSVYTTKVSKEKLFADWWENLSVPWQYFFSKVLEKPISPMPIEEVLKLESLDSLDLSQAFWVEDIEPLSMLRKLKYVNMRNTVIKDITPLRYAQNLLSLDISFSLVSDLEVLRYFRNLTELGIEGNTYYDIKPIGNLPVLRHLYASELNTEDYRPLSNLSELLILDLSSSNMGYLSELGGLENLEDLDLSGTGISSLSGIQNFPVLKTLYFDYTAISDVVPLKDLQQLEYLSIKGTQVNDLSPLSGLPILRKIEADLSQVSEKHVSDFMAENRQVVVTANTKAILEWWQNLDENWKQALQSRVNLSANPGIEELITTLQTDSLDISGLPVKNGEPIGAFGRLRYLNIDSTEIQKLDNINELMYLHHLSANNTDVSELEKLSNHPGLQRIELSTTLISNVKALGSVENLRYVNLDNTEVSEDQILQLIESKEELQVIYQTQKLMNWWNTLPGHWKSVFANQMNEGGQKPEALHSLVLSRSIEIRNFPIITLAPLGHFPRLRSVTLENTQVISLLELTMMESLEEIHYRNGPLYNLNGLEQMPQLKRLTFSSTPVENLDPISRLKNLEYLDCSGTQVRNIKELAGLRQLKHLNISNTRAWRIHLLHEIENIEELICFNSRVNDRKIEDFRAAFPQCLITYY